MHSQNCAVRRREPHLRCLLGAVVISDAAESTGGPGWSAARRSVRGGRRRPQTWTAGSESSRCGNNGFGPTDCSSDSSVHHAYTVCAMYLETSDASLWLETLSGSHSSFGAIYDRYRNVVYRTALARARNVTDAEDVVAMVFLEAWRKRDSVRFVEGSLQPWLLVVTVNVSLNRERSARRYRRLLAKIPAPAPEPDLSDRSLERIHAVDAGEAIRSALGRLTDLDKQLIELCLVENVPMADVAAALAIPVGTVKSRLFRLRQRLKSELKEFAPLSEGTVS